MRSDWSMCDQDTNSEASDFSDIDTDIESPPGDSEMDSEFSQAALANQAPITGQAPPKAQAPPTAQAPLNDEVPTNDQQKLHLQVVKRKRDGMILTIFQGFPE